MRRWSSGLRVVKLAEKRCTTKPPIHAQWKEGESVEEGAAVGARRPHQEFDPYRSICSSAPIPAEAHSPGGTLIQNAYRLF